MINRFSILSSQQCRRSLSYKNKGFTIIELVLVIILMGILAITVAPKMFNSTGFQEYAYQAEIVNTLRNVQLKAMQQTDDTTCHTVTIIAKLLVTSSLSCTATETQKKQEKDDRFVPSVKIADSDNITFDMGSNTKIEFSFDSLGRPVDCVSPCEITLRGSEALIVRIESEGFIHAL